MPFPIRLLLALLGLFALPALGCATHPNGAGDNSGGEREPLEARDEEQTQRDYLRLVVVRDALSSTYLMHWPKRKMPLAVHLPPPPPGLFENPNAVEDAVRRGVLGWQDVVEPGLPGFTFVDDPGDADIPIVWAREPSGDWYIAFCAYDISIPNRFGVSHILVTGRWGDGEVASLQDIYATTLHEMGHALGLMGHSENPADVMWPSVRGQQQLGLEVGLSAADRNTLEKLYRYGNRRYSGRRGRR